MINQLIDLRESALRLVGGGDELLNPAPAAPARPDPALPGDLAASLRAMKLAAASPDGARVDYGALGASPAYAAYLGQVLPRLHRFDPASLAAPGERAALWVNLYNLLILHAVVAYGVRRSVGEGGLAFFRRAAYSVGGLRLSAEDIEHGLLRANAGNPFLPGPQFAPGDPRLAWVLAPVDPRVHFALTCASRSCPPIAAYDGARLDAQLGLAARAFVAADVEVDAAAGALRLSSIFDWYQDDFGGPAGVVRFVRDHLPADDERRTWLAAQSVLDLAFKPYSWGLNSG